ncbi:MAG: hypothetical protein ACI9MR_000608 [Myxococcota bacterium]|jgi:hypothetical protein
MRAARFLLYSSSAMLALGFMLVGCSDGSDSGFEGNSCVDGLKNADETSIDCGGPLCDPCGLGDVCILPADCVSAICDASLCACAAGSAPDSSGGCSDIDECATGAADCSDDAVCTNVEGSFTCGCKPGFSGDGASCEPCAAGTWGAECAETCAADNCAAAVTCDAVTGLAPACGACTTGFWGPKCVTACESAVCTGSVTCEQDNGAATTCDACVPGFWGPGCGNACEAEACAGTVTCDQGDGATTACDACVPGFYGATCETACEFDDCVACDADAPCDTASECIDGFCKRSTGEACFENRVCAEVCVESICASASGAGGSCDDTDDCVDGFVCSEGICLGSDGTSCGGNSECLGICYAGLCQAPSTTGGACETTGDCTAGHLCSDGICLLQDGEDCGDNGDCVSVCLVTTCGPPAGTRGACDETEDCQSGHACAGGQCALLDGAGCDSNDACVNVCVSGTCRPPAPYDGVCEATDDCEAGLVCSTDGVCKRGDGAACTDNTECIVTCVGGVCGAVSQTQGPCEETADCAPLHQCVNGGCLRIDGEACDGNDACVNVCVGDVCAGPSAVGGSCDETADCSSGLSCIDDACLFDDGAVCSDNSECVEVCVSLVCGPPAATGGACDDTDDCVADNTCVNSVCLADNGQSCVDNTGCVNVCVADLCVDPGAVDSGCDEGADCLTGLVCNAEALCKRAEGGGCLDAAECATPNTACVGDVCATDDTPDVFSFADRGCLPAATPITSDTLSMAGFYGPLEFEVTGDGGPVIVLNGGDVEGQSAAVVAGDTVALRVTTAASVNETGTATASLGGVTADWVVLTAPDIAPGTIVADETGVMGSSARSALGVPFTVPETAVYDVHTYMHCEDRIHDGQYSNTFCNAALEAQDAAGSWASILGHRHHNGKCCTEQGYVLNLTTEATLSKTTPYRFRYTAKPRFGGGTTKIFGSSADVKFLTCEPL